MILVITCHKGGLVDLDPYDSNHLYEALKSAATAWIEAHDTYFHANASMALSISVNKLLLQQGDFISELSCWEQPKPNSKRQVTPS